jgi:anti-sigma-K factor RskA
VADVTGSSSGIERLRETLAAVARDEWPDAQHVPALWLIPAGDKPHSLGVVDAAKPITVRIPVALRRAINPASIVAVSAEPAGGSPTGAIFAKGGISGI